MAVIACALWATAATAAVYRWVDKQGEVHYSDVPVKGAQPVDTRTWRPSQPAPRAASEDAEDTAADKAPMSQEDKCALAKKNLTDYQNAPGLVKRDQYGAEHKLSDEERAQAIERAKGNVAKYCGDSVAGS